MNFFDISYLEKGNDRQKAAFNILNSHSFMTELAPYDPVLTGTIPIGIDIPGSDLDIICHSNNVDEFFLHMTDLYRDEDGFQINNEVYNDQDSVIVQFYLHPFQIEIFGQAIPSRMQYAYRHMIIEHALLGRHGAEFRQSIINLKLKGYSTEAAFCQLLHLTGDPFEALLKLEGSI